MGRLSCKMRRFRQPGSVQRKIPFLVPPNLRIAQVTAVAPFDLVETFPPGHSRELERYRPRVLLGSAADLERLAEQTRVGAIELSTVDHAIFILTQCTDKPASDTLRVILWQAFGAPIYELLIGDEGQVVASECEAHEGWHVEPSPSFSTSSNEPVLDSPGWSLLPSGLFGLVETQPCPCGRQGMRVMNVEQLVPREVSRELAATA